MGESASQVSFNVLLGKGFNNYIGVVLWFQTKKKSILLDRETRHFLNRNQHPTLHMDLFTYQTQTRFVIYFLFRAYRTFEKQFNAFQQSIV